MKDITGLYKDYKYDFLKDEDCNAYNKAKSYVSLSQQPLITFIMPVHNEYDEMNCTINSLLEQEFVDWELIIWDNSDTTELPYKLASNLQNIDERVRSIKSPFPMGFTKAFSDAIFNYARGMYCLYLGTGDLLVPGSMKHLSKILFKRNPDVVFSRTYAAYAEDSKYLYFENEQNEYEEFDEINRSEAMLKIMQNTFYNSFTNVMRTDFLKNYEIDFWTDYPSDCAGMQYVIKQANRIIITDLNYYISTITSSQTRGSYYIGGCYMFAQQWAVAKETMLCENYSDLAGFKYVSGRIYNNFLSLLDPLVCGRWRDRYMEKATSSIHDIIKELEYIFTDPNMIEMIELSGIKGQIDLINGLKELHNYEFDDAIKDSFISSLVRILLPIQSDNTNIQEIVDDLESFILKPENIAALGTEIYVCIMNTCKNKSDDHTVFNMYKDVLSKFENYVISLNDETLKQMIIRVRTENMKFSLEI